MRYFAEAIRNGKFVVIKECERGKLVGYRVMNLQHGSVGKKFATLAEARKVRKEKEAGKKSKQHPKRFYVSKHTEITRDPTGCYRQETELFYVRDRLERCWKGTNRAYSRRQQAQAAADLLNDKFSGGKHG